MNAHNLRRLDRRAFLRAAACTPALPLVGGLFSTRLARAQTSGPKRVVFVYTSNGAPKGLWLPNGDTMNLSTLAYDSVKSVCNFREVSIPNSGHGNPRKCLGPLRWGQDWTGDTLDQQIASVIGGETPFPSFALGVQTSPQDLIGRRSGNSVPCQDDPGRAFEQLFGSGAPSADNGALLTRRQRVMQMHRRALTSLKSELGAEERITLEANEQALDELEARIQATASGPSSEACATAPWSPGAEATTAFALQSELHSELIVAAFRCGITNVFTLQLGYHQGTWYGHDTRFTGDLHNSCHSAPATDNAEMTNYMSRCVAYLIQRLIDEDDPAAPGTKLIDNTVVVQVTDMGDGQDHSGDRGPSMVATRMPSFKQGTVTQGGTSYEVLEAVVEGLGLGAYKGTDQETHKIWPSADGSVASDILA